MVQNLHLMIIEIIILTIFLAAEELTKLGYFVFRMGSIASEQIKT